MTSRTRSKHPTPLLFGLLLVGFSVMPHLAYAQKGKPTPPPPVVLPPARYMIQWLEGGPAWGHIFPQDINQWGDVAGLAYEQNSETSFVFAYSEATGTFDVNDLGAPWWDLNAPTPTSVLGWKALRAYGINDWGDIAGTATSLTPNLPDRTFILQDAFGTAPRFLLLPTVSPNTGHSGGRINNHGEAIGSDGLTLIRFQPMGTTWPFYVARPQFGMPSGKDINDDGVVVYGPYRQLFAGALPDVFNNLDFLCISNGTSPWICGDSTTSGKGKNAIPAGPIRMPVMGTVNDVQRLASFGFYARAVNDQGDTTFESGGRGYLFYDEFKPGTGIRYGTNGDGLLPLDQLVLNPNADWLAGGIRIDLISNRDGNGLGVIGGFSQSAPHGAFLLIPIPAP